MSLENNSMGSNESEISTLSDYSNNSAKLKSALLTQFLKDAKISETQEKAFIESNKFLKKCKGNHLALAAANKISSLRCEEGVTSCPTKFEAILDSGVKDGDLPIWEFTLANLKAAKNNVKTSENRKDKDVKFFYLHGIDALHLHENEHCKDGDIVNLASQFNALESMSSKPLSVARWVHDYTQGPMGALQAVSAAKHRESAYVHGALLDAIKGLLQECKVNRNTAITDKYPELYKGGYLQLWKIDDINDLKAFTLFLKSNVEKINFLSQWVKCEGTGKKQLQVFTAAPSFQGVGINWKINDERTNLLKECCVTLVGAQYRVLAQAAAIRASATGKNVGLHVTMIGHGAFNNPEETIPAALKALKDELKDQDVTVYLHHFGANQWEKYL